MKTTIEISDPLLLATRRLAASEGATLREVAEPGLRLVLSEPKPATPFKLSKASFKGQGPRGGELPSDKLGDLAYEGRGGSR